MTSQASCFRCGAPLGVRHEGLEQRCAYCNAIQPERVPSRTALAEAVRDVLHEDRDGDGVPDVLARPRPAPPLHPPTTTSASSQSTVIVGAAAGLMVIAGVVAFLAMIPEPRHATTAPKPVKTVPVSTPPTTESTPSVPTVTPSASSTPPPSARAPASRPAAPKLTNEQFGKNVVAAQHKKLEECVAQDLLRNPDAPRAYTVTVLVERDGLPRNSATRFVPAPRPGFQTCGKFTIFHGFNNYGRSSPEPGEFTFTTSFAFPNAKPAAKASSTWDE